jgi:2-dehydro-3-deoxyphosphogluconate aldolase/(4S)-4-hydroxy-2-oxoglutarate aldolase
MLLELVPQLGKVPVIGILRGCPPDRVEEVAAAAVDAGILTLEVTFDSEAAPLQIARLRGAFPEAAIGAGTVLEMADLERALSNGASFIVTPVIEEDIVIACRDLRLPCLVGAATPTEIWRAHRLGAEGIKVFPAEQLGGPAYLAALRSPLGPLALVPTGGVEAANARAYLESGAVALGVGSSLFPRQAMQDGDLGTIERAIEHLVAALP